MSTNNPTPPADNHNVIQSLEALLNPDYASMRKAVADGFADAAAKAALDPKNMSQSVFQDKRNEMQMEKNSYAKKAADYKRTGNILDDFEQGIKDELLDALAGGDFKKGVQDALSTFTKEFGFELKDLPHELGKYFGKQLADSQMGQHFKAEVTKLGDKLLNSMFDNSNNQAAAKDALSKVMHKLLPSGNESSETSTSAGVVGAKLAESGLNSEALAGIAEKIAGAIPVAAILAVGYILLRPALEGILKIIQAWGSAWNKDEDTRKKRLEEAQKRVEKDYEYLAREPFEILTNAAKKWEETWDANLSKIALTQGYTKEDVYDLYESVSTRLYQDDLESAIAATDIINNLSSVLESGLSGRIAEEFAYEATKLGAAIPTQNFMGYASTYAQLASEAVSRGYTQSEAISYANEQLELFASNLLYSSRTLTGGFTTGLQNAESLFKSAVDIAQTAKTSNAAAISGTLTAVSGVLGSVAPDLAQGLVQNIVDAAIGGNSDTIVALRSLAGVNASNTEFLRRLATDPQGLFVTMFQSLGELQSMSPDNYMEVAEGLASVFGVDMKAFARVNFNELANQVANMQVNQSSLEENLNLLESGQATMSTEQIKLQEINNMILDEGLAYVIDSEAGRAIQQHMWEEQMNNALMENEYAVNLQGAALEFLEGIRHAIANILNFLNPIGYIANGISQMIAVEQTRLGNNEDIKELLELTAVGRNSQALSNLLTTGQDLQLVSSLVEMYGGAKGTDTGAWSVIQNALPSISAYGGLALYNIPAAVAFGASLRDDLGVYSGATWNAAVDSMGGIHHSGLAGPNEYYNATGSGIGSRSSLYSGFSIGKGAYAAYKRSAENAAIIPEWNATMSATQAAAADNLAKYQEFIDSAEEASKSQSFDAWYAGANVNVDNLEELTGITKEQLRGYYESFQSGAAGAAEQKRKEDEQQFWEDGRQFFADTKIALSNMQTTLESINDRIGEDSEYTVISVLVKISSNIQTTFVNSTSSFQKCLADWLRYMAEVKSYQTSISSAQAWSDLKQAEGQAQQETLLALANAMQVFSADELKKLDPQLQANALLGQIIVILQTMLQQNSTVAGGISLPETLSALGFGMTFQTNT